MQNSYSVTSYEIPAPRTNNNHLVVITESCGRFYVTVDVAYAQRDYVCRKGLGFSLQEALDFVDRVVSIANHPQPPLAGR